MGAGPETRLHDRPLRRVKRIALVAVSAPMLAWAWPTIELEPDLDNSLYESAPDDPPQQNELSNGKGIFLFAGRTGLDGGFRLRRALLKFDLSGLPAGSEVLAAELVLYQSRAAPGSPPVKMTLHRVLEEWGEGDSDAPGPEGQGTFAEPDDATWYHRLYDSDIWRAPGGDFEAGASSSVTVGTAVGDFTWPCTSEMVEELNLWLNRPERNFGWLLMGFEVGGMNARRFHSRHHFDAETRPRLRIVYRPPGALLADGFESTISCK